MKVFATIATFLLVGCVSVGAHVTEDQASGFARGVSTQADVEAKLGKPTTVIQNANGERQISYEHAYGQVRPSTFIPFIGGFVGGADTTYTIVRFRFGADGKLLDHETIKSQHGGGVGFAAGPPPQPTDQPR